jgi:hypothetical protein
VEAARFEHRSSRGNSLSIAPRHRVRDVLDSPFFRSTSGSASFATRSAPRARGKHDGPCWEPGSPSTDARVHSTPGMGRDRCLRDVPRSG